MAGDLAKHYHTPPMRRRVVVVVDEMSRAWRHVIHWLSSRLLLACRSGEDKPNGGVVDWNGAVARKVR